ncbi:MAG: phospholipid scramblase family protein [Gemmataceae bacterium]|nr:phospholipid scramblase family protein [Gemmataceae bacterium]
MLLDHQRFFVKERVAFFKTVDAYDIFDPDTNEQLAVVQEEPSALVKTLRWFISKKLMPTQATVYEHEDGSAAFSIHKPFGFFRKRVDVHDADGELVGYFKSKLFSLGGGFWVYDKKDRQVAEVKGKWTGWEFKFITSDGDELGYVTKKWAGLGKELFTSADNYIVAISDELADQPVIKMLLLAAALAIDMVYYEQGQ